MGPKIKMSSLEESDDDIRDFNQAIIAFQKAYADDLGTFESSDSQGLRKYIRSNMAQADTFMGRIEAAKGNAQSIVSNLEQLYTQFAKQLQQKVDAQHREQLDRLEKDQKRVSEWIEQYLDDLREAKQQVKLDPLNELKKEL